MKLDEIDTNILAALQADAGLSVAEVAEKVGLTASPCWRRIRNLEDTGIIRKRMAVLDHQKIGLNFEALVMVKIMPPSRENHQKFMDWVQDVPEVVTTVTITGGFDYVMHVMTPDMTAYNNFIGNRLLATGVVGENSSHVILKRVKDNNGVPLDHLLKGGRLHVEADF
ncbi:Lrp/AsnC family transcriptional regulator [Hyphobacterium sp. HN65]|uniref:Lrp/AsnC family transcriptional regulator n=1 Tax=Hyphobacterium lacteum TaxID=3116575 RepID=A0ABU7LS18_9PROT|nr:Lrp/AsnC family transcriptional regulator [Hyphobacterium sp. HN65]MEE2526124.1 Lrp/AsnC family transcriptional regulator [Hyphobacterium sp. HN65]